MKVGYKVALICLVIAVLAGLLGYLMAIESQSIERDIRLPETATTQLVRQAYYETPPSWKHIIPYNRTYILAIHIQLRTWIRIICPGGPTCLAFSYDGKPGIVQLEIPNYLIK